MKATGLICHKCGFKNLIGEKYCSECGSYLLVRAKQNLTDNNLPVLNATIKCPNCNFESNDDKKFCGQCGFPLRPDINPPPEPSNSVVHVDPPDVTTDALNYNTGSRRSNTSLLTPGTMLQSRYKITKLIGQGGMGAIYLADDTRFSNRVCVIKEMLDNFTDEEQRTMATSNFLREADMLASLHHDGIPEVYDRFSEGNRHYLVMEYIQGIDLEQRIEQSDEPFDEKLVLGWGVQICDILSYLHNQKPSIIYRDMKPANLILTKSGKIYMVDFGIARFFNPIKKGTMVGTQGYAPPEQYRGLMEPRSDIFALGATMHHLLTNRDPQEEPPFSFPRVRELNPSVSSATEKLIEKALEKDVSDRFETAEDMLKAIMKITSHHLEAIKVCPHCHNKVSATKQFCPYCNEYIASVAGEVVAGNPIKSFMLSPKFLISTNVIFVILNIILVLLLLNK
jgi:serine/threonine protein kinase